jgi:molecular chaperone DnaK (HSP70)
MSGRLAIDFGTSNTVVALWDESRHEGVPLHLVEYGRLVTYRRADETGEQISMIPSLIHFTTDNRRLLGRQVLANNLYDSERTCRWMKRYIARRSPVKLRLAEREISHAEVGQAFLSGILTAAAAEVSLGDEEVAFTVPVEAFEHYENWLSAVAASVGIKRFRLIDEPSAAALGYGAHIQPGDVYLIFDFGGGTLDVAMVLIDDEAASAPGRRCRVLGKAGADVGGATIDGWLFQEILRQNGRTDADDDVRLLSRTLLAECERAKEQLSFQDRAVVSVARSDGGARLEGVVTRKQLEDLFDANEAFTQIDHTIRRALNAARERGYGEDNIKSVLMVGGTSLIPSVQRTVQRIFGRDRVLLKRPLDAVARGAAAFVAGIDFYDHIQHDYAFRYVDPTKGDYEYRPIVSRGTPYPTTEPVARLTVKASHDGQTHLGIAIFELGERFQSESARPVELVFDPWGAARLRQVTPDEDERRYYFWINESNPTFLPADPPARRGEPRFEVEFGIDANKRLLITARDLHTKRLTFRNHPVVQLT